MARTDAMPDAVPFIRCDFNACDHNYMCYALFHAEDHTGKKITFHEGMRVVAYDSDSEENETGDIVSGYLIFRGTVYERTADDKTSRPDVKWGVKCERESWSFSETLEAISPKWIQGLQNDQKP
jgi:hypothetical protein